MLRRYIQIRKGLGSKPGSQWPLIVWWSGLPGGCSSRGKLCLLSYHSCQIYRTWNSIELVCVCVCVFGGARFWSYHIGVEGGVGGLQTTQRGHHLYGASWSLKTPCKDFNLAIEGGLHSIKWLKNGAGQSLYFMQLFLHYILFVENFIGYVKVLLYSVFSMLESQSWKIKIVAKMWRLKRWWHLSKILTITTWSLNFFNCPLKL